MTLKQLQDNGTLKFLLDRKYVTEKVFDHIAYVETYTKYRVEHSYRQACVFAANDHNVSIETIKRAIKGSRS